MLRPEPPPFRPPWTTNGTTPTYLPTTTTKNPKSNDHTDMTCFFRCLPGMNKLGTYCEKIQYALTSNCHNCPAEIINWAKNACLDYQVRVLF